MDWKNVQFLFYNPTELGNTTFGVNGPNYNIKGVELQINALLARGLTLSGSATYNQTKQTNSPCLVSNIPASPTFGQCITEVRPSGSPVAVPFQNPFGSVGSIAAFSPKVQASGRIRYDWQMGDYKSFVQVGGNYTGSMFNQPATYLSGDGVTLPNTTFLRYKMPAYATLDASIGISRDSWYAQVYGTNLNNSHASTFTSSTQFIKAEVPIRPRVFGLRIGYDF
jgi:outer membrane receptor protein involved in Fe transport